LTIGIGLLLQDRDVVEAQDDRRRRFRDVVFDRIQHATRAAALLRPQAGQAERLETLAFFCALSGKVAIAKSTQTPSARQRFLKP